MRLFHYSSLTAALITTNAVSFQSSQLLTNNWRAEIGWNVKTCLQERDLECKKCEKLYYFDVVLFYGKTLQEDKLFVNAPLFPTVSHCAGQEESPTPCEAGRQKWHIASDGTNLSKSIHLCQCKPTIVDLITYFAVDRRPRARSSQGWFRKVSWFMVNPKSNYK